MLRVHRTTYCYSGDADPKAPGGMAAIYRDLAADDDRARQITADVAAALARGRHCLVFTQSAAHLNKLTETPRDTGPAAAVPPVGTGARARNAAPARLTPQPAGPPVS